jgi:hypothetical protein
MRADSCRHGVIGDRIFRKSFSDSFVSDIFAVLAKDTLVVNVLFQKWREIEKPAKSLSRRKKKQWKRTQVQNSTFLTSVKGKNREVRPRKDKKVGHCAGAAGEGRREGWGERRERESTSYSKTFSKKRKWYLGRLDKSRERLYTHGVRAAGLEWRRDFETNTPNSRVNMGRNYKTQLQRALSKVKYLTDFCQSKTSSLFK